MRHPGAPMLRKIKAHLKRGGIIAYATEGCYGLGCDPDNARAVARVYRLKRRPCNKGMIVIAARFEQVSKYVRALSAEESQRARSRWPGPTTWLMPAHAHAPRWLMGKSSKIALRVSAHAQARRLCAELNLPLVSTSANVSSRYPVRYYRECLRQFGRSALVIPGLIGKRGRPSTILDLTSGVTLRG